MAACAGIEPANAGVKDPCLTTWLTRNIETGYHGARLLLALEFRKRLISHYIVNSRRTHGT